MTVAVALASFLAGFLFAVFLRLWLIRELSKIFKDLGLRPESAADLLLRCDEIIDKEMGQ